MAIKAGLFLCWIGVSASAAETLVFQDPFTNGLAEGWTWRRENPAAWCVRNQALEVRIEPGNLWGGANNARNVLLRPVPAPGNDIIEISVTVENQPTGQYEQSDLAWYYDDGHMVKLGQERVNGKRCIVMGREFDDQARTLGITPEAADRVRLRLRVEGNQIRGDFLPAGATVWQSAGRGDLPAPPAGQPQASLHCYQGPPGVEHWARFTQFQILRIRK